MVRRFFKDSVVYVIPTVVTSAMAFVLFPFYARHFTPRQYGIIDLLTVIWMLVGWTVALEIYQGAGRYVTGEKDQDVVRSYASTALWFAIGCYSVFLIVVEAFAVPISHVVFGPHVNVVVTRTAAVWIFFNGILMTAQSQLRWQLRPVAFATAGVVGAVVTVSASAVLVFAAGLEVEGAVLGQVAGVVVALAYVMVAAARTFKLHFHRDRCREMLTYSVPLIPESVGVFLNLYADRLVIQHIRSLYDVGLYGVAYRIAMIMSLLLAGFQGAATPLILARKDEESTPRDIAQIFRLFTALALSAFVFLSLFAAPMLRLLAAPEYQSAASLVPFLVISVLFANMYPFAPGLVIAKRTVTMSKLGVAAGVANLVLALLLVPPLGITGAGIATAVTSLGWFAALYTASQRHYRVPHRADRLVRAFIAACGIVAVALAVLPDDRAGALGVGSLLIRAVLVIASSGVITWLVLGTEDVRRLRQTAAATPRAVRSGTAEKQDATGPRREQRTRRSDVLLADDQMSGRT